MMQCSLLRRELIIIADKNGIKVSYNDPAFLDEVVNRLQPVKRVKVAEKEHNGFKKAYIELQCSSYKQTVHSKQEML